MSKTSKFLIFLFSLLVLFSIGSSYYRYVHLQNFEIFTNEENLDAIACEWDTSQYLIISDNVFVPLIYYSHISTLILSLLLGFFILFNNKKALPNILLFLTTVFLAIWIFGDLVLWATEKPELTMFFWSIVNLVEPMVYAFLFYFFSTFIEKKDISLTKKIVIFGILLPTILLTSTNFALSGYDLTNCDRAAIEGPLAFYGYAIEIFFVLWIIITAILKYRKIDSYERKQLLLLTFGVSFFLLSFALGNIAEAITGNWSIGQYGLIGIPIFIFLLTYLIVKFKAFDIKLIGSQALIIGIIILNISILFIREIENIRIVIIVTIGLTVFLGYQLIIGVKREIKAREDIEIKEGELKIANIHLKELDKLKTEFLSLATHQLRSPLTAIKGYTSMILDNSYGVFSETLKEPLTRIFQSTQNLAKVIEDFLNVSKIEQGGLKYQFVQLNILPLLSQVTKELEVLAQAKGLELKMEHTLSESVIVFGDEQKLRQVFLNFIDNAIKYTPTGSIRIIMESKQDGVLISIVDTGVGISADDRNKLFQKFGRTESGRLNTGGSGLGLYLAKQIVHDHKGSIDVQSEGKGKGTTFSVFLPFDMKSKIIA